MVNQPHISVEYTIRQNWELVNQQDMGSLVGADYSLDNAVLSPDGRLVAWMEKEKGLCLYARASSKTGCYDWPWQDNYMLLFERLSGMYLSWSSDSQYLAFAIYPFTSLPLNTDIWVFDNSTKTFLNLTDDGQGGYYRGQNKILDVPIDYLPIWHQRSNEFYFFRTKTSKEKVFDGLFLYRVSVSGGKPELVKDLSQMFAPNVLSASVSNNGQYIAFSPLSVSDGSIGVWLLDLSNGSLEQLVFHDDFLKGMPKWTTRGECYKVLH
jgi:Tol biopolymer transport system component